MEREIEIDLARQMSAGNAGAFERFVDHFRSKIFQYSWLMCGQREDAEEVAQETLLSVFENFDRLREPERVRPWVFRIAKNACLMKRRKSVFAPQHEIPLDACQPANGGHDGGARLEIADRGSLPDEQALQAEMRENLRVAIGQLPEIYRTVVLLRDLEELTTEETAQVLDLTEETVKTRLRRARLALREKLGESSLTPVT